MIDSASCAVCDGGEVFVAWAELVVAQYWRQPLLQHVQGALSAAADSCKDCKGNDLVISAKGFANLTGKAKLQQLTCHCEWRASLTVGIMPSCCDGHMAL